MEWLTPVKPGFGGFDEPYERANVVFVGVPLDITSSYRSGYRFGPARIREASANLETYLMAAGLDVFERLNISDLGDLEVTPTDLKATGERILRTVQRIKGDEKMPVLLGGEHTLTYFAAQAFDDVFVVQLDAHRDLRDEYLGDKICHATVMRRVLDFLPHLDVLDPAFAPGVATPEPGGPSTVEISRLVRELGKLNIWAFDVVELVPPHDDGTAAFAAAKIIYELLAAIASSSK